MSPKNERLMKLFDEAIAHWERMIAWAERQPGDDNANPQNMFEGIKEDWFGESCRFCQKFVECERCLLVGVGFEGCCAGLWRRVCGASTWGKWVFRAKDVLAYIKEKRDESISHKSR